MIRTQFLDIPEQDLNIVIDVLSLNTIEYYAYAGSPLSASSHFRKKCIKSGYKLLKLYEIYYTGWDMDEHGALAIKDGKHFILETDHGSLTSREIDPKEIQLATLLVLKLPEEADHQG